ncbi:MAG: hypothetical protein J07HQX50_02165, partial [Haloquadratum sp. J07HQX50]
MVFWSLSNEYSLVISRENTHIFTQGMHQATLIS